MGLEKIAKKSVVTISKSAGLEEAAKIMREMHVGDLVVTEDQGHGKFPIGILTDRDIVVSTLALGIDPKDYLVEDVMSTTLATTKITDNLFHVMNLMKENGYRRVPLVNGNGALVGIVSVDDIMGLLASELTALAAIPKREKTVEVQKRRKFA